jgi:CO/xanthine dehydrogenase FAD-binding subunit
VSYRLPPPLLGGTREILRSFHYLSDDVLAAETDPVSAHGADPLFLRPTTLEEAVHALAESRGTILSGGTDFFPALVDRPMTSPVIDISGLAEIKGFRTTEEHIHIGGRTTWSEIVAAPLPRGFAGLKAAAREVGCVQIQNLGTIAGNLCNASPAADSVPALLALDAEVMLASVAGTRSLPLGEFLVCNRETMRRPDEILTSVAIPRHLETSASTFLKLGSRRYLVISIAMVAANLLTDRSRRITEPLIAVGACSAKAQRLPGLERALTGEIARPGIGKSVKPEHLASLSPLDDVRATSAYRIEAVQVLVRRALEACVEKLA